MAEPSLAPQRQIPKFRRYDENGNDLFKGIVYYWQNYIYNSFVFKCIKRINVYNWMLHYTFTINRLPMRNIVNLSCFTE